ncbi:MAG TPA: agmatine deiminase family protein [Phycisphaerae bacterium]|nr:agmatine deiminase family protein [Phycisphaerae bacterium]
MRHGAVLVVLAVAAGWGIARHERLFGGYRAPAGPAHASTTAPAAGRASRRQARALPPPGEFQKQSAIILGAVELVPYNPQVFVDIVAAAHRSVPIIALVASRQQVARGAELLRNHGLPPSAVRFVAMPVDTAWIRDYGPVFIRRSDGKVSAINAEYSRVGAEIKPRPADDHVPELLAKSLGLPVVPLPLDFDGGNLLTNGEGLCVSTTALITANSDGDHDQAKKKIARLLSETLGMRSWLYFKPLEGEASGHADMFVAFVAPDVVVVGRCDPATDPVNARNLDRAAELLAQVQTSRGQMQVHRIPMPPPAGGFWRTYTNVIFANGTLLMPIFHDVDPAIQEEAITLYARLLPGWKIVGIQADGLVQKMGLLHCVALNVPDYVKLPKFPSVQVVVPASQPLTGTPGPVVLPGPDAEDWLRG